MWLGVFVVFVKEVVDNLRDRRSLLFGLIYPLLGPILLGAMVSLASGVIVLKPQEDLRLAIQDGDLAPGLVAYLEGRGIAFVPAPDDPSDAVRRGLVDSVIIIPKNYAARFRNGRPASVEVLIHPARLPGMVGANRTLGLLVDYNRVIGKQRLRAQGIDIDQAVPLAIKSVSVAKGANIIDVFLFMVPPFIIFTVFMSGVYLALDTTSGERERGSLEPLLVNPVPRWGLMLGKFLAALLFTAIGLVVQLAAFKIMFQLVGEAGANLARNLDLRTMMTIFVVALPLMMLAVGVQIIIAIITRSFKEAQTYLGLLPLIPAIPGMALVFFPVEAEAWMMTLPTFGQTLLFGQLVRGEPIAAINLLVCGLTTTLVAAALLAIAGKLYEGEALIFGR